MTANGESDDLIDDDLLMRFTNGDPDAFADFYRRHASAILEYFVRRCGSPEAAAD